MQISDRPTIAEIHELYRTGQASVSQITEQFLERIEAKNPELNAFYKTTEKVAREQAEKLDLELETIRNKSQQRMELIKLGSSHHDVILYDCRNYDVIILNIDSKIGVINPLSYNNCETVQEWKTKFQKLENFRFNFVDLTSKDKAKENKVTIYSSQNFEHMVDVVSNYECKDCLIVFSENGHVLKGSFKILKREGFGKKMTFNLDREHDYREDLNNAIKSINEVDFTTLFDNLIQNYPLFGIPFATKAIIQLEGEVFNASSKIMDGFVAPFSATVMDKILAAGAVLVGINNMDQWAMGSSGESSDYGNIKNPFDTSRTPGGSSSGAVACVASGQVVFSLGTDTGGSIRQPAAFCDVVGLKPTYGLVSRWGVMPMASSFDQVGAVTNTVADNILVNKILAGRDSKDQTTIDSTKLVSNLENLLVSLKSNQANQIEKLDTDSTIKTDKKKFKIGLPKEFYIDGIDPIIRQAMTDLQQKLTKAGHEMVEVDLPLTKYAVAVYYMTMGVEVASNLERIDGVRFARQGEYKNLFFDHRDNFGDEAKRRIMLGTYASSSGYYDAYYNQAQKVRELARQDFVKAFEKCDLILTPTTPEFPFKLGSKTTDPLKMYLSDVFTCGINPVRIPGLTVPLGLFEVDSDETSPNSAKVKLPTGCQILAPELKEDQIYELALEIEEIVKSGNLNKV